MDILQLILLALIQGLTEFLPISSSGHLVLLPFLTGAEDQGGMMDLAVHFGSLFAVITYFYQEVGVLLRGFIDIFRFKNTQARRIFISLSLASIPVLAVGAILVFTGANDALRSPWVIAVANLFFAGVLWWSDQAAQIEQKFEDHSFRQSMMIGLAQVLALIPGTSRSGITLSAARFLGYNRIEAARFALLLSIPTILAGGAAAFIKTASEGNAVNLLDMTIGAGLSFLAALLSIHLMMKLLRKISLMPFVIYRIVLGLGLILFLSFS